MNCKCYHCGMSYNQASAVTFNKSRPYGHWPSIQAIADTEPDGKPGPNTADAVRDWQADHGLVADGKVGPTTLYAMGLGFFEIGDDGSISFDGKGSACADGDPGAYHPNGHGIDYNGNAGWPDNGGYGLAKDGNGTPYIQGERDPKPGFFVAQTAMNRPGFAPNDPRRYVDAGRVPYVVLPGNLSDIVEAAHKPSKGDVCQVTRGDVKTWAIYAEVGPDWRVGGSKYGEASIAALEAVGHNPWTLENQIWRAKNGASDISYQIWPGSAGRAVIMDGPRGQELWVDGARVGCC